MKCKNCGKEILKMHLFDAPYWAHVWNSKEECEHYAEPEEKE